jgi:hypothetical protein
MIPIDTIEYKLGDFDYDYIPHYKVIILIIASQTEPYNKFAELWQKYMNRFSGVRSFFLYSDPNADADITIYDNKIIHKHQEWYEPGILYKTLAGMFLCNRLFTYDYILRTNLSSFIHIPRLLTFLEDKPLLRYAAAKQNIYREGIGFLSGAGFILSKDVVVELIEASFIKKYTDIHEIKMAPDDVAITMLLERYIKIDRFLELPRYDCDDLIDPSKIDDSIFHIRNKTEWKYHHRRIDIENMDRQVTHFYEANINPSFRMIS